MPSRRAPTAGAGLWRSGDRLLAGGRLGPPPRLALAGLAASLSAALASHYYAVFLVMPLALAEAVRTFERRRLDLAMWLTFAAPAVVLALHLPLLRAGASYSGTFWAPPQWVNVPDFYDHLLAPAVVPVTVILVLAAVHAALRPAGMPPVVDEEPARAAARGGARDRVRGHPVRQRARRQGGHRGLHLSLRAPGSDRVRAARGVCDGRGAPPARRDAAGRSAVPRRMVPARAGAGADLPDRLFDARQPRVRRAARRVAARRRPWRPPLVIADPHTITVLSHYGAPELRERMVYLADPERALEHLGHNSVERGMLDLLGPGSA
jgi:hypothetical protein